jgi:hypothetical protein
VYSDFEGQFVCHGLHVGKTQMGEFKRENSKFKIQKWDGRRKKRRGIGAKAGAWYIDASVTEDDYHPCVGE